MVRLRKDAAGIDGSGDIDGRDQTTVELPESADFIAACHAAAQSVPVSGADVEVAELESDSSVAVAVDSAARGSRLRAKLRQARSDIKVRDARLTVLSGEIERMRSEASESQVQLAESQAWLAEALTRIDGLEAEAWDLAAECAAFEQKLADQGVQFENELADRGAEFEKTLDRVRDVSDRRADESAALQAALHAREGEVVALQQQLLAVEQRRGAEAADLLAVFEPFESSSIDD